MRLVKVIAILLPLIAVVQSAAPTQTNFSGRWRMVKEKSDFSRAAMPDIIVRVIEQRDPTMNVHTVQTSGTKTTVADISYFTDGTVASNVINGHDAKSKAFWDGAALMIRTDLTLANGESEVIEDRWELSEDGETLTTTSHITTSKGEADLKLVCTKEKVG